MTSLSTVSARQPQATEQATIVVKLGGSVLSADAGILDDVATLAHAGQRLVVIHGGGPAINEWLARLGIVPRFIAGRRVTDAETLEVARAVMAGQISTEIVRLLGQRGLRAIGLSGMDAGLIRVQRATADLGLVGVAAVADLAALNAVLAIGAVPVVTPLGLGPDDECLNVNADDVATAIAVALGASDLIFMSDVPGVHDATGRAIPELTATAARQMLATGEIAGGMVPKIEGCLAALDRAFQAHEFDAVEHGIPAHGWGATEANTQRRTTSMKVVVRRFLAEFVLPVGTDGSAYGIRTRDLRLERAAS